MKKFMIPLFTFLFLLLLLMFPSIALKGARTGLMLWFETVLPTLLPFMIASTLIMELQVTDCLTSFIYPVFGNFLGLSKKGCYPFLIGMLSGLPVGAKACADLVKTRQISREEGQYLLCFCNNASPMFVISFIAAQCLHQPTHGFLVLAVIYGSALLTGACYKVMHHSSFIHQYENRQIVTSVSVCTVPNKRPVFAVLDQTILTAFEILTKVGGYIILFSILAEIMLHLVFLPAMIRYCIIGFLEVTTGSAAISLSHFSITQKIVLIHGFTAFGGLSSHAQTYSVIMRSGLSIKTYFIFKCINACIAGGISLLLITII